MKNKSSKKDEPFYLLKFRSYTQRSETKKLAYNMGTDMKNLILEALFKAYPDLKDKK